MGIQRLQPVSEGTDWSKYTNIFQYGIFSLTNANVETDIININGKGFFDRFILKSGWQAAGYSYTINFYVDGVKKHVIQFNSSSTGYEWRGVYLVDYQKMYSTIGYVQIPDDNLFMIFTQEIRAFKQWGDLNSNDRSTHLFTPIFFDKNLRITAKVNVGNDTNMKFLFSGGIM